MLPDFVVIGAMKAGTTSLHHYLDAHPGICMSSRKDTTFLAPRLAGDRDMDWYRGLFADDECLTGETSVGYSQHPAVTGVPGRLCELNPDARIVYVVRDPIRRLLSHYMHNLAQGRERRPIDDALETLDDNHYANCSRYAMQIDQYLAHFDRERILVIAAEALAGDRAGTMRRLFAFLGVDDAFVSARFDDELHRTAGKRQPTALGRALRAVPGGRRLVGHLPLTTRPLPTTKLGAEQVARLRAHFDEDVRRLERFTGEHYDAWTLFHAEGA